MADTPENRAATPSDWTMRAPTEMGPTRGGVMLMAAAAEEGDWKAKAGRREGMWFARWVSPWSCIRTLMRSRG